MANYLERIVNAGARIAPPAARPALAPPCLPDGVPDDALSPSRHFESGSAPRGEARSAVASPGPIEDRLASKVRASAARPTVDIPATREVDGKSQDKPTLAMKRDIPALAPAVSSQIGRLVKPGQAIIEKTEAPRTLAALQPEVQITQSTARPRDRIVSQSQRQLPGRDSSDSFFSSPRRLADQIGIPKAPPALIPAPSADLNLRSDRDNPDASSPTTLLPAPPENAHKAESSKQPRTTAASIWPLSSAVAPMPSLSANRGEDQHQITIGRVDVQVNNHLPVTQPRSLAARGRSSGANALETRYLERFPLKR